MALEQEELTGKIIGAAIEVNRQLGRDLLSQFMKMLWCLNRINVASDSSNNAKCPSFTMQKRRIGKDRLDLFVEREIVVDLKAISELLDIHFAVVKSQLRVAKRKHGPLLFLPK